jgi:hypothetical protein
MSGGKKQSVCKRWEMGGIGEGLKWKNLSNIYTQQRSSDKKEERGGRR